MFASNHIQLHQRLLHQNHQPEPNKFESLKHLLIDGTKALLLILWLLIKLPTSEATTYKPCFFMATHFHPTRTPDKKGFKVIWDSGASLSVTPDERDFVGPIKPLSVGTVLSGIVKGAFILGEGTIIWSEQPAPHHQDTRLPCSKGQDKATIHHSSHPGLQG